MSCKIEMVRTWVSGGQSSEVIDKLRQEVEDLETSRDRFIDSNKARIFEWASRAMRSEERGSVTEKEKLYKEAREIIAEYDSICQTIFDKEVLLSERLDEQAKFDSLG